MNKIYIFACHNWKSGLPAFYVKKTFPSVYYADLYAMRISFKKKKSPYLIVLLSGMEYRPEI